MHRAGDAALTLDEPINLDGRAVVEKDGVLVGETGIAGRGVGLEREIGARPQIDGEARGRDDRAAGDDIEDDAGACVGDDASGAGAGAGNGRAGGRRRGRAGGEGGGRGEKTRGCGDEQTSQR